jgi:hypothetical protein
MNEKPELESKHLDHHGGSKRGTPRKGPSGPRTELGKQRSKVNAVKYGIFSGVLLLGSESRDDFASLLSGLQTSLQPVGTLEETLVDQLATSYWRYRRMVIAESAEIAKATGSEKPTEGDSFRNAVLQKLFCPAEGSLKSGIVNRSSEDLTSAISSLIQLHGKIKREGLSWERDRDILEEVFGPSVTPEDEKANHLAQTEELANSENFVDQYRRACAGSRESEQAVALDVKTFAEQIENMVVYLDGLRKEWIERNEIKRQQTRAAALIPKDEVADKLLRYQTTLERSIERTLTQLERLQRMRLGQPVPPPIKVQIAG